VQLVVGGGEKRRKASECDARSERYTKDDREKEMCADFAVDGRMMQVLNSKSDNTSDKKAITKNQYEVVWGGWLYIGME